MLIKKNNIFAALLLLVSWLCLDVSGAEAGKVTAPAEAQKPWKYEPVDIEAVTSELSSLYTQITKGDKDGKPVTGLYIQSKNQQILLWVKRQWIELETGVQRAWFKQVIAQINYLAKCKKYLELAKFNRQLDSPNALNVMKRYVAGIKKFDLLIKNPTKMDKSTLSYMKRKRQDWLKDMAKKEKARLEEEKAKARNR